MISKFKYNSLTWIDLDRPTYDELKQIVTEWDIHPAVAQELIAPSVRPKVELYPNFIYLILNFPVVEKKDSRRVAELQEIDFVIGKNFIITSRYGAVDSLHHFSKVFEVDSILDKTQMDKHAGFVFFYMLKALYQSVSQELEAITGSINEIEEHIFKGKERAMVNRISEVGRELLGVRRAISLHKEVLESFEVASQRFFGHEFIFHSRAILGEYYKVRGSFESNFEFLSELRETNNSLLTTKQNEVMKTFTVMAFITFPLMLVTGIFTMHAKILPIFGDPIDFWVIILGMVLLVLLFLVIFKKKRLL
ncbi:MAG: CorA family divalent cation transporter [Patescibacteria group bacterium]